MLIHLLGRSSSWGLALIVVLGSVPGTTAREVGKEGELAGAGLGDRARLEDRARPGDRALPDPRERSRGGATQAEVALLPTVAGEGELPGRWHSEVEREWELLGESYQVLQAGLQQLDQIERQSGSAPRCANDPGLAQQRRLLARQVGAYRARVERLRATIRTDLKAELVSLYTADESCVQELEDSRMAHWRQAETWSRTLREREQRIRSCALYDVGFFAQSIRE